MAWILQSIQRDERQPQSLVEHLCIDYLHWERSHFGGLETKRRIPERKKWFQEEGRGVPDWRKELESGEKPKGQRSAWRQMLAMPRDFDV